MVRMPDHPHDAGVARRQAIGNGARAVAATVVDDHQLVAGRDARERRQQIVDRAGQVGGLVMGGDEGRQLAQNPRDHAVRVLPNLPHGVHTLAFAMEGAAGPGRFGDRGR